ncbi:hypothetical protein ACIBHX_21015 [Nonomuraea sp. NPDC050536]|uniref:hypothetical protein n=1 Tax=Nonomuraea sp. NPDC050536 TaxID=3364366 RepID=UPI0037C61C4E
MAMNEEHIQEVLDLERQKLAIQFAATEVRMDDKIRASERRIIDAVTGAITNAVVELKGDIMSVETGLRTELAGVRTELAAVESSLKGDIARLEQKIDNHVH